VDSVGHPGRPTSTIPEQFFPHNARRAARIGHPGRPTSTIPEQFFPDNAQMIPEQFFPDNARRKRNQEVGVAIQISNGTLQRDDLNCNRRH